MASFDTASSFVTIVPYFHIIDGKLEEFKALWSAQIEKVSTEEGCIFYEFSFSGNHAFCREGYVNADAALTHFGNVGAALEEVVLYHLSFCEYFMSESSGNTGAVSGEEVGCDL